MSQIKVSIIMPVYNSEKFLNQTLDSILMQSFREYEIIAVNDGSTDGSRKILEEYSIVLKNMQIIDQVNSGVSTARNKGLSVAKGEYVCFIDADDWVHPDFLRIMIDVLEKNRADIVFCQFEPFYNVSQLEQKVIDERTIVLCELRGKYGNCTFDYVMQLGWGTSPCNKVYKTDVLKRHNINFEVNSTYGEDMFFNWKAFLVSYNILYVNKSLYGYRQNIEGATFKYHPNLYKCYQREYEKLIEYAKIHGVLNEQLITSIKCNLAERIPTFLRMNQRRKAVVYEKYKYVKELINKVEIYQSVEVMQKLRPIQSKINGLLYRGILQHKTFQVFLCGFYAEYRFRIGRKINCWRKKRWIK